MIESEWRTLYRAAILELDPKRLQARVKAAEDAIPMRLQVLGCPKSPARRTKRNGRRALATLRVFETEAVLTYRDSTCQGCPGRVRKYPALVLTLPL